jgi:hypothetical protein
MSLLFGHFHPTDLNSPNSQLLRAAREGDLERVRACLTSGHAEMDIESALDTAAAHSHLSVVEFLVNLGAEDLDSALLSAVARDDARVVRYLISKQRPRPATNAQHAQVLASNFGSLNAEWVLASRSFVGD